MMKNHPSITMIFINLWFILIRQISWPDIDHKRFCTSCRVTTIGPRCPRLLYLYFILHCSMGACIIRCSFISVCVRRAHLIFYSKLRCEHNHLYLLLCCLLTSYVVLLKGIATTEYIYLLLEAEISTYSAARKSLHALSLRQVRDRLQRPRNPW